MRTLEKRGRRRLGLRSLLLHDCATAIMTEVYDGVVNRLEDAGAPALTEAEQVWLHAAIGTIADRFHAMGTAAEARLRRP